jgi:hypothetical protein
MGLAKMACNPTLSPTLFVIMIAPSVDRTKYNSLKEALVIMIRNGAHVGFSTSRKSSIAFKSGAKSICLSKLILCRLSVGGKTWRVI